MPGDTNGRFPKFVCQTGHSYRSFAGKRLGIEGAFAGNDQVGRGNSIAEFESLGNQVETGMQFSFYKMNQPESQATRSTGTGSVCDLLSSAYGDEFREKSFQELLIFLIGQW